MTKRLCICGKPIRENDRLCHPCYILYGEHSSCWPDWLREWMRSYEAELYRDGYELTNAPLSVEELAEQEDQNGFDCNE